MQEEPQQHVNRRDRTLKLLGREGNDLLAHDHDELLPVKEKADRGDVELYLLLIERGVLRSLPDHRDALGGKLHPRYLVRIERGFDVVGIETQGLDHLLLFLRGRGGIDEKGGAPVGGGDNGSVFELETGRHLFCSEARWWR
jgi:hypothetical protein